MSIPELVVVADVADVMSAFAGGGDPERAIGDDERTSYGRLLDRAAERGLLTSAEYQVRLRLLAEATTDDEMRQIVTELPVLDGADRSSKQTGSAGRVLPPGGALAPSATPRRRSSPWFVLAAMVLVLVVALVFFAVYADHLAHVSNSATAAEHPVFRVLSDLRS